ncbi:MAG: winged helix-turn-helix transcriptional regulator [Methanobacteriota archaeon]
MVKIDLKDRKILYELDIDARQSLTQIGKKVGLKKDVVSYRIKKMEEEGVIENYWTAINTFKLGYDVFRIYINFRYITSSLKEEIIKYFVDYKNSWVVVSMKTEIDLDVVIWVKDIFEFYQFWEKTLDLYQDYFEKYALSIYIYAACYRKSFLLPDEGDRHSREMYEVACGGKPVDIDKTDYQLLNEIAENARLPLVDIGKKIGISAQSVNYRLKNLVKSGVINAFRVNINLSKLDLHHYRADIFLKDHKLKKPILNYLKEKPYLEFMNLSIGWADLEPEFIVKDMDELLKILDEINTKFSGTIKKQSFFVTEKFYKLRCLPQL